MNLKYEVGQTVKVEANKTVVELMESEIKSITVCSTGAKYLTSKGAFSEEQLDAFALKAQPIAPQEDKPRFSIGQRVIATDNTRHFIKQIATILDIDKSDPRTPFKVKFDERGLIMWCHSGDVEPCPEPEQLKEPIKLYCVKDYKALLSPMFTRGKIYETDENEQIKADSGLTTYRKWNSDKMKKEFPEMFASLIPLVKRPAKVGEWVVPNGENKILEVEYAGSNGGVDVKYGKSMWSYCDYLVLDGYTPEPEQPKSKYESMSNDELKRLACGISGLCCPTSSNKGRKSDCPFYHTRCEVTNENRSEIIQYLIDEETPELEKEPEPVYYSGEVICVSEDSMYHTQGKKYVFKNGVVNSDEERRYNPKRPVKTLSGFNDGAIPQFIPYLGE